MSIQPDFYEQVWAPVRDNFQSKHDQLHECYLLIIDAEKKNPHMVETASKKFFEHYKAFKQDFSKHTHFGAVALHIKTWCSRTVLIQQKAMETLKSQNGDVGVIKDQKK
jgi:hypothetical protein